METTKKKRLKRKSSAIMAAVLILALLLTGTFAWISSTQSAINPFGGEVDYHATLHDDFNPDYTMEDYAAGVEKSVYAENTGPSAVYIRIRLDEFMEIGKLAGQPDGTAGKEAVALVNGSSVDDVTTWTPHIPLNESTTQDCSQLFHDYWTWTMGGSKFYMPAEYQASGNFLSTSSTADTVQDRDATGYVSEYDGTEANVQETAEDTRVMTMERWISEGMNPGPFWVIDTDGWAYWAQALEPGTATGLLLSELKLQPVPNDDYYYAINVIMQAASVGDWEFDNAEFGSSTSQEAKDLLNKIAGITPSIKSVSISNGSKIYIPESSQLQLSAAVVARDGAPETVAWAISSTTGTGGVLAVNNSGLFTAGSGTAGRMAVVSATSTSDTTMYATTKLIVIPYGTTVVKGEDGNMYVDYGDNTFSKIDDDGTLGDRFCGGVGLKPGDGDDRYDLYISQPDGNKYLGPNENGSYEKFGPDDTVIPGEGELVWKIVDSLPIGPDNETTTPPLLATDILSIKVEPAAASVVKGNSQTFTATVTMGDNSVNNSATWAFSFSGGATSTVGGSTINPTTGVLTVGANETASSLVIVATATGTNGSMSAMSLVTVRGEGLSLEEITAAGFRVVAYADASFNITGWNGAGESGAKYVLILTDNVVKTSSSTYLTATFANVQEQMDKWFAGTLSYQNCPENVKAMTVVPVIPESAVSASVSATSHGVSSPTAVTAGASASNTAFPLSASEAYLWAGSTTNASTTIRGAGLIWWTRSGGGATSRYWNVTDIGSLTTNNGAQNNTYGVRPALWVKYDG